MEIVVNELGHEFPMPEGSGRPDTPFYVLVEVASSQESLDLTSILLDFIESVSDHMVDGIIS